MKKLIPVTEALPQQANGPYYNNDGEHVEILCTDTRVKRNGMAFPIAVQVYRHAGEVALRSYPRQVGKRTATQCLYREKPEQWVNLYWGGEDGLTACKGRTKYKNKEAAEHFAKRGRRAKKHIASVKLPD